VHRDTAFSGAEGGAGTAAGLLDLTHQGHDFLVGRGQQGGVEGGVVVGDWEDGVVVGLCGTASPEDFETGQTMHAEELLY